MRSRGTKLLVLVVSDEAPVPNVEKGALMKQQLSLPSNQLFVVNEFDQLTEGHKKK